MDGTSFERHYRIVQSRDPRFDGWFLTAVTSTGIYCRPSCPALTPKRANVRFYPTAAAAQGAGFRACKRCRPDAVPGSPEWDLRADLVGRAMRLIADGVVDREGVGGLARRLGYSERHVARQLVAEVGASPLALARAQRAHTTRVLLETTDLPVSAVAFAAGFASIRQCNDTVREVFALPPTELRRRRRETVAAVPGAVTLRLPYRTPFAAPALWAFLAQRAVFGVEAVAGEAVAGEAGAGVGEAAVYRRALVLPHGLGTVELGDAGGHVRCTLRLEDLRDLAAAVARCRRLCDLDADPVAVDQVLGADPLLGTAVRRLPGLRVPGAVDGAELAVRAVLGQQVSVAGARTVAGRLAARFGRPLPVPVGAVTRAFPTAAVLAEAPDDALPMPAARRRAVRAVAAAVASGDLVLDPGADRAEALARLGALPGIGSWTVAYVALRALRDPDALPATDLGVRHALDRLGVPSTPAAVAALAERWRPWRSYATLHLWVHPAEWRSDDRAHRRPEPDRALAAHR